MDTDCNQAAAYFEATVKTTPPNRKQLFFEEANQSSTYSYAIVAGPLGFRERRLPGMPCMRIYARKSKIGVVDSEKMFDVIESGITFYQEFFGTPYPFGKYDTVFVPE